MRRTLSFRTPSSPTDPTSFADLGNRTSIQGGSQAMEDGVTLAVTLGLAGKGDIPTAVRAYEKIR